MKNFKLIVAGFALALAPAVALGQSAAPPSATENPAAIQTTPQGSTAAPVPGTQSAAAPATAAAAPAGEVSTPKPAAGPAIALVNPTPGIGMPDGRMGIQDQFNDVGVDAKWFHNAILMPAITIITLIVLGLLIWVVLRYRAAANPIPSRTSHNTVIEVIWTLLPVLILLVIAVPSIRLLAKQYSPPKADLTVKVIGNQWYWTYQYPDNGDFEVVSNMLKEGPNGEPGRQKASGKERARTDADGPSLLAVDERMVVPAGAVVKIITTSNDVIHSFAVPAFWNKMDAVPGRLNETWFKVDRPGVYFGQCSELCGARHAFMPIAVEVVPPAQFAAWVASKGGTMPGAGGKPSADATAGSPAVTGGAPAAAAGAAAPPSADSSSNAISDATVNATTAAAPVEAHASDTQ